MDTNATELEMRMFTLISSICGLFSHEQANSLLTRSFPDCKDIEHKTDCMRTVLEKSCKHPDIFFSKLNSNPRFPAPYPEQEYTRILISSPSGFLKSVSFLKGNGTVTSTILQANTSRTTEPMISRLQFPPLLLSGQQVNTEKKLIMETEPQPIIFTSTASMILPGQPAHVTSNIKKTMSLLLERELKSLSSFNPSMKNSRNGI